uniref:Defensin beta 115 n=1 Tax=Pipistrellus kuhlii TaxID=59472 RepID=A0A7J7Y815_PIPKU|nr:defensin beta 115 [Pipistrellus kuhlii]
MCHILLLVQEELLRGKSYGLRVGPKPIDWHPYKKTQIHTEGNHVKMERRWPSTNQRARPPKTPTRSIP